MAELVTACPRCGANKITFDILKAIEIDGRYGWQHWYEVFSLCRHCRTSTVFVLSDRETNTNEQITVTGGLTKLGGSVNHLLEIERFVNIKDIATVPPPEHLPDAIRTAFLEGAQCFAVGCYDAAGTMFRLCVDLATKELVPETDAEGLNGHIRRTLGPRLKWLLDTRRLLEAINELSTCIRDDGNDGAHVGSLRREDAEDLLDFTTALLERLYTEPARLRLAKDRRDARRGRSG